jgi:hypothetical protein
MSAITLASIGTLNLLPSDTLEDILKDLPTKEILKVCRVCKDFRFFIHRSEPIGRATLAKYGIKMITKYWIPTSQRYLSTRDTVACLDLSTSMEIVADENREFTRAEWGIWYLCKKIGEIPHLKTFGITIIAFNKGASEKRVYSVEEAIDFFMKFPTISLTAIEEVFASCKKIEADNTKIGRVGPLEVMIVSDLDTPPLNAPQIFNTDDTHEMNIKLIRFDNTRVTYDFQRGLRDHFINTTHYQSHQPAFQDHKWDRRCEIANSNNLKPINHKKRSHLYLRAITIDQVPKGEFPLKRRKIEAKS